MSTSDPSKLSERHEPVVELQRVPDASDSHSFLIVFDAVILPIPEVKHIGISDEQAVELQQARFVFRRGERERPRCLRSEFDGEEGPIAGHLNKDLESDLVSRTRAHHLVWLRDGRLVHLAQCRDEAFEESVVVTACKALRESLEEIGLDSHRFESVNAGIERGLQRNGGAGRERAVLPVPSVRGVPLRSGATCRSLIRFVRSHHLLRLRRWRELRTGGRRTSCGAAEQRRAPTMPDRDLCDELDLALRREKPPPQHTVKVASLSMTTDSGPRRKAAQLRAEADARAAEAERLRSEAELWDRGADGEDTVQALLEAGLPADDGWRIERSVVVSSKGTDIDHIVVGPAGVFTINSKHHPGKRIWVSPVQFLVDGHTQDYLRNSTHEATRAEQRLGAACGYSVHVQSVIVVVGAASFDVVEQPVGPRVESADSVVAWLRSLPAVLSAEQAGSIAAAVSNPDTWIKKPAARRQVSSASTDASQQHSSTASSKPQEGGSAFVIGYPCGGAGFARGGLRHSPTPPDQLERSVELDRTTSTQPTSTTAPATFQALGTVTNGQCIDAWFSHGVEVEVSGAEAGTDCTSIASPGEVANETSSAAAFGALTGPYGRATVGTGLDQVCSSTLASGDRVTVYDEGSAAFGHAFCTSFRPARRAGGALPVRRAPLRRLRRAGN